MFNCLFYCSNFKRNSVFSLCTADCRYLNYFLNPSDIEFVSVKVSLPSYFIFVTCSYIPPGSDFTIYEQHMSAIRTVLSHLSERDLLIVLGES